MPKGNGPCARERLPALLAEQKYALRSGAPCAVAMHEGGGPRLASACQRFLPEKRLHCSVRHRVRSRCAQGRLRAKRLQKASEENSSASVPQGSSVAVTMRTMAHALRSPWSGSPQACQSPRPKTRPPAPRPAARCCAASCARAGHAQGSERCLCCTEVQNKVWNSVWGDRTDMTAWQGARQSPELAPSEHNPCKTVRPADHHLLWGQVIRCCKGARKALASHTQTFM